MSTIFFFPLVAVYLMTINGLILFPFFIIIIIEEAHRSILILLCLADQWTYWFNI